jgi:hypothetical protein
MNTTETEIKTGIDVLRRTLHARNRSPHALSLIAGEIPGAGVGTLEDFAAGKADLSVEALQALARILYDAEYDPESGMLRSANKTPPQTMPNTATYLPKFAKSAPYHPPSFDPNQPRAAPQPLKPEPLKPRTPRPGWIE